MQPKLLSTFDKFLLGGLGCGVIVLCVIAAWIFYIGQSLTTPLQSQPTVDPALISSPTHLTINIRSHSRFPNAFTYTRSSSAGHFHPVAASGFLWRYTSNRENRLRLLR